VTDSSEHSRSSPAMGADIARLISFSDSIIAIVLTIMIFNLKPVAADGWAALIQMRPALEAYGLSYMFVAVCWLNHHHLLGLASRTYASLIWSNFVFLFTMSFLPISTAYLSIEQFSPFSIQFYALSFMPMLASYMVLETVVAFGAPTPRPTAPWFPIAMTRGCLALSVHGSAALVSAVSSRGAFVLILVNAFLYISPERLTTIGPWMRMRRKISDRSRIWRDRS
jgi:uncharacterized membrane protein